MAYNYLPWVAATAPLNVDFAALKIQNYLLFVKALSIVLTDADTPPLRRENGDLQ
jgi:hypothetical protein